jgi:hypothetical protein
MSVRKDGVRSQNIARGRGQRSPAPGQRRGMEQRRIEPLIIGAEDGAQQHPCRLRVAVPERLVAVLGIEPVRSIGIPPSRAAVSIILTD